jgi:hypothetical protein
MLQLAGVNVRFRLYLVVHIVMLVNVANGGVVTCSKEASAESIGSDGLSLLQTNFLMKSGFQEEVAIPSTQVHTHTSQAVCGDQTALVSGNRQLCTDISHFNETLLVIHFNYKPRAGTVPFLLQRYSQCFGKILVTAPEYPPDCSPEQVQQATGVSFLKCEDEGLHTQQCYAAALIAHPGFRSYLIMNDDALFIPKDFMAYSTDRWWNTDCNPIGTDQTLTFADARQISVTGGPDSGYWWAEWNKTCTTPDYCKRTSWSSSTRYTIDGVHALVSWWWDKAPEDMKKAYTSFLGKDLVPATCWQDFVHIPKQMVPFYLAMAADMPHLQLELFNAMVKLSWNAMGGLMEEIPAEKLYWDWEKEPLDKLQAGSMASMIHPLKVSNRSIWPAVDDWLFGHSHSSALLLALSDALSGR